MEILRTLPRQRDFARFVLKRQWENVFRVSLSSNTCDGNELSDWCETNCVGHWSRSTANEVYYFEKLPDATLFRLRWAGMVPESL